MAEATARDRILEALKDLPRDATYEDAIERLVFLAKVDEGLAQLDAGQGVSHDEAKRRLGL
jgi:predicted transcriptional regulator